MNLLRELPLRDADGGLHVVVETPRGAQVKLRYDEELGVFLWSRALPLGVTFPYDFGFFPRTLAEDGDPLDALVIATQTSGQPGVVVPVRAIGAARFEQERPGQPKRRNDRIIVTPVHAQRPADVTDVGELLDRTRGELEAFFPASLALTGKRLRFLGWAGHAEAEELVRLAEQRFSAAMGERARVRPAARAAARRRPDGKRPKRG